MSQEVKTGVGALIVCEDYFLTIEELYLNRSTQKIPGMRSIVYETVEPGESDQEALVRALTIEELNLGPFINGQNLAENPLCRVQLNPGIWLTAYLLPLKVPMSFDLAIGTAISEVARPNWDRIDSLMESPIGAGKFRPGNREVMRTYLRRLFNEYEREVDEYLDIEDRISEHRFNYLEASQTKSQFPRRYLL